jgi:hypothetical protein
VLPSQCAKSDGGGGGGAAPAAAGGGAPAERAGSSARRRARMRSPQTQSFDAAGSSRIERMICACTGSRTISPPGSGGAACAHAPFVYSS